MVVVWMYPGFPVIQGLFKKVSVLAFDIFFFRFQISSNQRATSDRLVRRDPDLRDAALLRHLPTESLHPRRQPRTRARRKGSGLAKQPQVRLLQQGPVSGLKFQFHATFLKKK